MRSPFPRFRRRLLGAAACAVFGVAGLAIPAEAGPRLSLLTNLSLSGFPEAIAVTPDGSTAYVTTNGGTPNFLWVVNTAARTVVNILTVGNGRHSVAVAPNGRKAYVTNSGDGTISVIDTSNNVVSATLGPLGNTVESVAFNPSGTRAYASFTSGPNVNTAGVFVFDTATDTPVSSYLDQAALANRPGAEPPGGGLPLAINRNGTRVYLLSRSTATLDVFDTTTSSLVNRITLATRPVGLALSPDGKLAYVTGKASFQDVISVVDTTTGTLTRTIALGTPVRVGWGPVGIRLSADGASAYVTNFENNIVSAVDLISNTVSSSVALPDSPTGIALSPAGNRAYVTDMRGRAVSILALFQ
jgi:YVTN family beta-propeller protein